MKEIILAIDIGHNVPYDTQEQWEYVRNTI